MLSNRRPSPSYLPRPAGRPSLTNSSKPGDKVTRKSNASAFLTGYDWRGEVLAGQARSLPIPSGGGGGGGAGKGVMMVPRLDQAGVRPGSAGASRASPDGVLQDGSGLDKGVGGMEVGLEALIADGRGKREKRATTATSLGFDFIANPSITALPDTPLEGHNGASPVDGGKKINASGSRAIPARQNTSLAKAILTESGDAAYTPTPETPGFLAPNALGADAEEEEEEEDDDEWERVSAYCDEKDHVRPGNSLGQGEVEEFDGGVIVLGELELDDPVEPLEGLSKTKGRVQGQALGKVSYAAALGKAR